MSPSSYQGTFGEEKVTAVRSAFGQSETFFAPASNASVHREHLGVAHLLQVIRGQGRAKSAATVEHQGGGLIGYAILNIAFDDSFAEMNGVRQVIGRVFAFFAHVDQHKLFLPVELRFNLINRYFANPPSGIFDDLQKTRGMLMSHESSIRNHFKD